jgi:hypothetical protein
MPTQTNPFDIDTPDTQRLGVLASAAPTMQAAQSPTAPRVTAPAPVQTRTGTAESVTARQAQVDPATQTVQGQLAGILSSGSPLLVQAQTRAKQQAQKRGLLNSSMAVGAGESALYDAALPIAQQDAGTYSEFGLSNVEREQQAALANQAERNTMTRTNIGEQNTSARLASEQQLQAGTSNAQLQQQTNLENARLRQQAAQGNQEAQTKLMLQQMDADTRVELVNIEANYKTLMQASQSASDLYQQTLKNISDITMNKDLNAAAKNSAIQAQKDFLRNGMNLIGSMNNLGIGELLNFGGSTGAPEPIMADTPTTREPRFGDSDYSGGV